MVEFDERERDCLGRLILRLGTRCSIKPSSLARARPERSRFKHRLVATRYSQVSIDELSKGRLVSRLGALDRLRWRVHIRSTRWRRRCRAEVGLFKLAVERDARPDQKACSR